jgi:hypothetical protein
MKATTALDFYKTQQVLAAALGITQAAVSKWGEIIPEKQALKLDRITGGQLKYDASFYAAPDKTGQEKARAA